MDQTSSPQINVEIEGYDKDRTNLFKARMLQKVADLNLKTTNACTGIRIREGAIKNPLEFVKMLEDLGWTLEIGQYNEQDNLNKITAANYDKITGSMTGLFIKENLALRAALYSENRERDRYTSRALVLEFFATDFSLIQAARDEISKMLEPIILVIEPVEDKVPITFHYLTNRGVETDVQKLHAPSWEECQDNYPPEVAGYVEELMRRFKEPMRPAISIWQGPPGTGKTTALRCLARELKEECTVKVILDPESMLDGGISYIMKICGDSEKNKNILLVLEDAGELISVDTRSRRPQAISRLLNMTDGMLGQGTNLQILITTNEPIKRLDPALLRPGRCLGQIVFRQFSKEEANVWLAYHDLPKDATGEMALAELYAKFDTTLQPLGLMEEQHKKHPIGFVA